MNADACLNRAVSTIDFAPPPDCAAIGATVIKAHTNMRVLGVLGVLGVLRVLRVLRVLTVRALASSQLTGSPAPPFTASPAPQLPSSPAPQLRLAPVPLADRRE